MSNIQTGISFTTGEISLINSLQSLATSGANEGIYKITATTFGNRTFSSGTVGPGTINEIAYFDTATSIASLAVATYPSLTELSYVKGVTSAIQTQLNTIPSITGLATKALDNLASVAMNASLQFNNTSARTLDIASTANTVAGNALTISAGSTVTGGTVDMAGGNLTLNSGLGKGTGASSIVFQTGKTLTTGSTLQTLTTAMTILGSGNVGIGTTVPSSPLDVLYVDAAGSNKVVANFKRTESGTFGGSTIVRVIDANNSGDLELNSSTSVIGKRYGNYADLNLVNNTLSAGAYGNINFVTGNNVSAGIAMTIGGGTQKGNVGIGTSVLASKLGVLGNLAIGATYGALAAPVSGMIIEGNVGIGTTNIGSRLVVKGSGTTSATSALNITDSSDVSKLYVRNDGNVGIGTTNPVTKLDFGTSATNAGKIINLYSSANVFSGIGMDSSTVGVRVYGSSAQAATSPVLGAGYISSSDGTTYTELFRVQQNGNVGIGTTGPSAKLHSLSTTEQLRLGYDASNYNSFTVGPAGSFTLSAIGTNPYLALYAGGGGLYMGGASSNQMRLSATGGLSLGTGYVATDPGAGSMIISGNVGIGTTSPNAVAILDLTSTTKGFLPTRMTTAQRTAITAVEGLTLYDTDLHKLYCYDGTVWNACW